jgi:hypothetical protein
VALPGGFFSTQVTVVPPDVEPLFTLVSLAIGTGESTQPTFTEFSIQVDGAHAGTLAIGDANLSSSRYGLELISPGSGTPSPVKQYGGNKVQAVPMQAIYVKGSTTLLVNVSGRIG